MGLVCESVTFGYGGARAVLRGVTGEFPCGCVTAVVGPNGCGKSTLLRVMLGVLKVGGGAVRIGGGPGSLAGAVDVGSLRGGERARRVAYVPQRPDVWAPFTVAEVVGFGRYALGGMGARAGPGAVERALVRMELADLAGELFGTLSEGQRQRVAVARVAAQMDGGAAGGPGAEGAQGTERAVLADEPFSAMDPRHALRTLGVLREMADARTAVVVVLHDLTMALRFADRAVVMSAEGRVAAAGVAGEVLTPEVLGGVFEVGFERQGSALVVAG